MIVFLQSRLGVDSYRSVDTWHISTFFFFYLKMNEAHETLLNLISVKQVMILCLNASPRMMTRLYPFIFQVQVNPQRGKMVSILKWLIEI